MYIFIIIKTVITMKILELRSIYMRTCTYVHYVVDRQIILATIVYQKTRTNVHHVYAYVLDTIRYFFYKARYDFLARCLVVIVRIDRIYNICM